MALGLVQLFNTDRAEEVAAALEGRAPNHLRGEAKLDEAGFVVETIPPHRYPYNPFARMHNAYRGLDPLRALRVLLFRRGAACICAHAEASVLILLLRRLVGFRPKIVVWDVPWAPGWRYREFILAKVVPRADMNVTFSSNHARELEARFGGVPRVRFLPFCVDTEFFAPGDPGGPENGTVLSVGRDWGRDFDTLIRSVRGSDIRVIIRSSNAIAWDPSVDSGVSILREHLDWDRYKALYRDASVVVVGARPTVNACGITSLLEAMAMGKAVIASDTAPLRDYLPPAGGCIVVPIEDAAAMRDAIDLLLGDPDMRARMGRIARAHVLANFTPALHFSNVAALYRDLLGDGTKDP